VNSPDDPLVALARRLRGLREEGLAGRSITQRELAKAFSKREQASVPLISSWENTRKPTVPPASRLEAYATFFATEKSVTNQPYLLLEFSELTSEERRKRSELLSELNELREAAIGAAEGAFVPRNLWHFPENQDVTIICAELPEELRHNLPYADPDSPDFVKMYRFTDLDALLEIHGYIRSINPETAVNISTPAESLSDLFTAHLVVLGGVDWNPVTRDLLRLIELPVRQEARPLEGDVGGFEVGEGEQRQTFRPTVRKVGPRTELLEDVAHFYRGPNPLNKKRTVTICNGMFGRGTLGAVRTLTDPRFRDRNEAYIREHLGQTHTFSVVARVFIVSGEVVTPDWTLDYIRLHEWPKESSEHHGVHGESGSV
jgi:hypothetical protein